MSRFKFLLSVTILVVAGTLAFIGTSGQAPESTAKSRSGSSASATSNNPGNSFRSRRDTRSLSSRSTDLQLSLPKSTTAHLDSIQLAQVDDILADIRREARTKLDKLALDHKLTSVQRRAIYPYIVAHHKNAHPSIAIDGQFLPAISPGTTLEENVSSFVDAGQKDSLADAADDSDAWWEEVVGQLENDLDAAIDNGEMVAAPEENQGGISVSNDPAEGDGEASEHSGGNLFDLLGQ